MSLKLNSSGGGSVTLQEPSTATNGTLTFPEGTGNVTVNGLNSNIVSGTAVASTSGTSIDFTGIPSWVRRITVVLNGVSTNGTSISQIQLGTSAGVTTTGYTSHAAAINGGTGQAAATSGHISTNGAIATMVISGNFVFTNISGNSWVGSGVALYTAASGAMAISASTIGLASVLDRVRITTVNGTDTFDAGTINILYE